MVTDLVLTVTCLKRGMKGDWDKTASWGGLMRYDFICGAVVKLKGDSVQLQQIISDSEM